MNKETLKHFIEYRYKQENIVIDDFCLSQSKWEVQVVWRPKKSPYLGDDTYVAICETEEYYDWKKDYIRKQKLKKLWNKIENQ